MREICTYGLMRGRAYPTRGVSLYSTLLLRLVGDMKGGDGFDVEDEYDRFRRRQRIHRMHLVGYVVSGALILIGMLLFWH